MAGETVAKARKVCSHRRSVRVAGQQAKVRGNRRRWTRAVVRVEEASAVEDRGRMAGAV
jgi:hypothetical protein